MFSDTITITINSVAKVLNRINSGDPYASEYFLRGTTDEFRLRIRHSSYFDKTTSATRNRHNVEFTQTEYAVAPSTVNRVKKSYIVLEEAQDESATSALNFDLGFVAFFNSANTTKLLNWES